MKIFHTENNKDVVYVQLQDIMYLLNETDIPIPATIFMKQFKRITIVNDSNRFNFVRFDMEHEVKFFKDIEFIIDFDQYKVLSDEQLEKEVQKFGDKANKIAEKWNSMTEEEKKQNISLCNDYSNFEYIIKFLSEIYAVKHKKRTMPFPNFVEIPKEPKKSFLEE